MKLTALPSPPPAAYGCPYVLGRSSARNPLQRTVTAPTWNLTASPRRADPTYPAALPARLIPTSLAGGGFPLEVLRQSRRFAGELA